jgi:hypothetical protein
MQAVNVGHGDVQVRTHVQTEPIDLSKENLEIENAALTRSDSSDSSGIDVRGRKLEIRQRQTNTQTEASVVS